MEALFGSRWRRGFERDEQRFFSRINMIIKGINVMIDRNPNPNRDEAREEELTRADREFYMLKRKVTRMVNWLQGEGYVGIRSRRRRDT